MTSCLTRRHIVAAVSVFLGAASVLLAEVKLASPFTDHMVLQRDLPVPVWGTTEPGENVSVEFAGQKKSATADPAGHWRVVLDPLTASSEPRTFVVSSGNSQTAIVHRQLSDVLVGEVWLGSGQSNMVFTVSKGAYPWAGVSNEEAEIAAAHHPLIRMFTGAEQKSLHPQSSIGGAWLVCTPENVPAFSAVGYYFARELQRELQVPVGFVTLAYGASCAHAWIRREVMLADPEFKAVLDRFDEQVKTFQPATEGELAAWRQAADEARAAGKRPPRRPGADPVQDQHNPTVMFNGMIAPVVPFAIRGVLWYQGESITAPRELFPRWNAALIADWRRLWGRDLPFFFCQLAALDNNSNSPEVRAWQAEALEVPGTAMAVTIDIGDVKDVHPHVKAPLGERLARIALAKVHGRAIAFSGPVYRSMEVQDGAVRLAFTHRDGGLVAKGGPLQTFEVAGADGRFVPAEASIDGDTVVVKSAAVPGPESVRYAWSNFPAGCNLYNGAGLPAAPFHTARPRRG